MNIWDDNMELMFDISGLTSDEEEFCFQSFQELVRRHLKNNILILEL